MPTLINGRAVDLPESELNKSLLDYLRESRDLTGTKDGCGAGFCGTCTILVDGKPLKACQQTVSFIVGKSVLTIEGLSIAGAPLHPLQKAFIDAGLCNADFAPPE